MSLRWVRILSRDSCAGKTLIDMCAVLSYFCRGEVEVGRHSVVTARAPDAGGCEAPAPHGMVQGGLQHPLRQLLQQPALAGQLQPVRPGAVDEHPDQLLVRTASPADSATGSSTASYSVMVSLIRRLLDHRIRRLLDTPIPDETCAQLAVKFVVLFPHVPVLV